MSSPSKYEVHDIVEKEIAYIQSHKAKTEDIEGFCIARNQIVDIQIHTQVVPEIGKNFQKES